MKLFNQRNFLSGNIGIRLNNKPNIKVVSLEDSWLVQNPDAYATVLRGIEQAKQGIFAEETPDFEADFAEFADAEDSDLED
ncbi:MAG: hypothetical protein ACPGVO_01205 [Spirulinaceae cyanobacterium]